MQKLFPNRYGRHFCIACKIAIISFSYVEAAKLLPDMDLLVNAMGCSSWRRTAPSSLSQASLSIVKGLEKLSIARTCVVHITCFIFSNAHSAACVNVKASFFNRVVNGAVIFWGILEKIMVVAS